MPCSNAKASGWWAYRSHDRVVTARRSRSVRYDRPADRAAQAIGSPIIETQAAFLRRTASMRSSRKVVVHGRHRPTSVTSLRPGTEPTHRSGCPVRSCRDGVAVVSWPSRGAAAPDGTPPALHSRHDVTERAPLNRALIAETALSLIDERGLDQPSMRKLGVELGVEAMSLYNYRQQGRPARCGRRPPVRAHPRCLHRT